MSTRAEIITRVAAQCDLIVKLCTTRPHSTLELRELTGQSKDNLKNRLAMLERAGRIKRVGLTRHFNTRRGGKSINVWAAPGVGFQAPEYKHKTRWVTRNPYNPEVTTP